MNEFNINLVGKEENVKKEEILNNFDFNYLPMNNLPISYFPFNNPQLSNELNDKDIDTISGTRRNEDFTTNELNTTYKTLTFTSNNTIKITEDINVDLLLVGGGGGGSIIYESDNESINLNKIGDNYYISFLNNTNITFNYDLINCEILIVGGGGGGSWYGGGGGGGMVIKINNHKLLKGSYNINIGNGGIGGTEQSSYGRKGNDTTININNQPLFIARGGGGGGQRGVIRLEEYPTIEIINNKKYSGGIGGNSPKIETWYGRKLITKVNNNNNNIGGNGGSGLVSASQNIWSVSCGGGGGAGNTDIIGNNGFNGDITSAGNGGDGQEFNIIGSPIYYGGGGGGGSLNVNVSKGGKGGGGNGNGNIGTNNTGGGGGGGGFNQNGGDGGSGIVIIKLNNVGSYISGGGGGETKYIKDYNLKKGLYDINIGIGGIIRDYGKDTYIMKNNKKFLKAIGGNKPDGLKGGLSHKNILGKGGDALIFNDNSQSGELINIEGTEKAYGNGGVSMIQNIRLDDRYSSFGNGGGISASGTLENSFAGVFILKYKNNDIEYIKKNINISKYIDLSDVINTSLTSADDTNKDYKLLIYNNTGKLKVNYKINCDILLVGGGGGGGYIGGGGGGGDVVEKMNYQLNAGTYNITIGSGGNGGTTSANQGINGGNTTISFSETPTSYILGAGGGGGGGSSSIVPGLNSISYGNNEFSSGGYGGSAFIYNTLITTDRIYILDGEKNDKSTSGGSSKLDSRGSEKILFNGGGGGSKENGKDGDLDNNVGGNGGEGDRSKIKNEVYGGGGGGGGSFKNLGKISTGGLGGGGNSGYLTNKNGSNNSGGGGGGGVIGRNDIYKNGGAGGSGIVIIRVKKEDLEEGLTNDELYKKIDKDTRIIDDIKNEFNKKLKGFYNNDMPYNKFSIYPLVILIIIFWIFIFLFLLKFVHHYFANIYLYILIFIIIFLLLFGSLWFLYSNNDL